MENQNVYNSDLEKKIEKWKRLSQEKQRDINNGKERKLSHKRKPKNIKNS